MSPIERLLKIDWLEVFLTTAAAALAVACVATAVNVVAKAYQDTKSILRLVA